MYGRTDTEVDERSEKKSHEYRIAYLGIISPKLYKESKIPFFVKLNRKIH